MHSQRARRREHKVAPVDPPAHQLLCSEIQSATCDSIIECHICKEDRETDDFYFMDNFVANKDKKEPLKGQHWKMSALVQAERKPMPCSINRKRSQRDSRLS